LKHAADRGVATEVVDHRLFNGDRAAFEAALQATIAPYEADILCLAGFMRVLTADFVTPWAGRMLNIHPSLLPKYKGLHTHQRALDAGDTHAGCTVHEVTAALDDGPILGQVRVPILPSDTADDLAARVLVQEHILYPAVLRHFAAGQRTPLEFSE
jgi:phosphoribosylglycinamide formyltransferase-1